MKTHIIIRLISFLPFYLFTFLPLKSQTVPQLRVPLLLQSEKADYNPDNTDTYAVYGDFNTVLNPILASNVPELRTGSGDNRNFCMWNEDGRTCLGYVTRNDWNREYYSYEKEDYIEDEATGKRYMIKAVRGLPLDRLFWVQALAGSFVTFVMEFELIPDSVKTISFIEPPSKPFNAPLAYYDGNAYRHMSVEALKRNTGILKYVEVKVVK